ncbi:hypothetical protein [Phenylobacterium sp.]|uniref:hypothetical protein n=1 Tax=Phenylobacterium sp. TaxID=1871053 RepID=UPI0025D09A6A|nr:hypothetical protein [Phenylobacterium sp.]
MPVMCIYRGVQVSPDEYDRVRDTVGWEASPPEGAIAHAIAFGPDGATEVNLWESEASFRRYLDTRLAPVLGHLGVSVGEPEIIEVYSMAVGDPAQAYHIPRAASRPLQPA